MKRTLRKIVLAGAITLASLFPMKNVLAQPQENPKPKTNISVAGNLANKLKFWGMPFLDSPVYSQSVNVNRGKFDISLVGKYDIKKGRLFDIDTGISFSQPISDKLNAYLGYVFFNFNLGEGWDYASVLYGGLAADLPLNPSVTYNKLFRFGGGEYIEGSVSHAFPLGEKMGISLSQKAGYNNKAGRDKTGFSHLETGVSVPIQLSNRVNITPYLNYLHSLSDEVKSGFYGGINVNYPLLKN
jgi:hypothetical protein